MELFKLRANKESFRATPFNSKGISLVVAKKRTENEKSTYNSVGKSLSIVLIYFCLASSKVPAFEELLQGRTFYPDLEMNGKGYTSCRTTEQQNVIFLNDEKMSLAEFRSFMGQEVFGLTTPVNCLTFRSLISRFIHPKRSSYDLYWDFVREEQDYVKLLNNSYLLRSDMDRIIKKNKLKEDLDGIKDLGNKIQKNPMMKSFSMKDEASENVEAKIIGLEKKMNELQCNIDSFVIAEDYSEIRKSADRTSASLRSCQNGAMKYRMVIANIEKSLQYKPDITKQQLIDFYNETKVQLSNMVVRRLEEIEAFNAELLDNRATNLLQEKTRFERFLSETESKIAYLGHQKNEKLQYLASHGVLNDYTQLTKLLAEYRMELSKLEQYKQLVKEYKTKLEEVKKGSADEDLSTNKYLEEVESLIKKNILIFQSLAEQFYEDKTSGIMIESNSGASKLRFDIKAGIMDDTGDDVNEVRISCFDWTLLKGQYNHSVKFIFHDSRLVSENSPHQVTTILKTAQKECVKNNFQCILSVNQSTLDLSAKELSEEEYEALIVDTEVLELNDVSDANKLLGIQLDLDYTKE